MPFFEHTDICFHYLDEGEGVPLVFQHGLGGDASQPAALVAPMKGFRFLSLDCRGHGRTTPLGDHEKLNFSTFASDVLELFNHLKLRSGVVGGISMGAGVALRFALDYPERVAALILVRPAWLFDRSPENLALFPQIASLISMYGAQEGKCRFEQLEAFKRVADQYPTTAHSYLRQFERPQAEDATQVLKRLPRDSPVASRTLLETITLPTLVITTHDDPVHPYSFGKILCDNIPGAQFSEVASKQQDAVRHALEVRSTGTDFLASTLLSLD